jgi:hypothetical protein
MKGNDADSQTSCLMGKFETQRAEGEFLAGGEDFDAGAFGDFALDEGFAELVFYVSLEGAL